MFNGGILASRGLTDAVGKTPLIRLNKISAHLGRNVWGKAEFQNPGGSVKDRAALYLIQQAEKNGHLDPNKPDPTIVEGSAGNTAIGLAHIARARGYRTVFFMPDSQSPNKSELLKSLGSEVHRVPVVPISNPLNFNNRARDLAKSLPNAVWTNQFDNPANWQAHYHTTGPEIFSQLRSAGLSTDAFTCSSGTGGTFSGVAKYLYEATEGNCKLVVADSPGSVNYPYIKFGSMETEGSSFTEGIGNKRITENLKEGLEAIKDVDALLVPDEETIVMIFKLLDEEGIYVGGTAALNVVAACKVAQTLPEGSNVATILCDSGFKYSQRILSKRWLKEKKFYHIIPKHLLKYASLD